MKSLSKNNSAAGERELSLKLKRLVLLDPFLSSVFWFCRTLPAVLRKALLQVDQTVQTTPSTAQNMLDEGCNAIQSILVEMMFHATCLSFCDLRRDSEDLDQKLPRQLEPLAYTPPDFLTGICKCNFSIVFLLDKTRLAQTIYCMSSRREAYFLSSRKVSKPNAPAGSRELI
jgi:hypothetical protein